MPLGGSFFLYLVFVLVGGPDAGRTEFIVAPGSRISWAFFSAAPRPVITILAFTDSAGGLSFMRVNSFLWNLPLLYYP